MRRSALQILPTSATKWTVLNGPAKGSVRLMDMQHFVVGRSPECEFLIINDPKCSRKHAEVQNFKDGCHITSLNESNPVLINGQPTASGPIGDGDVLTFGETQVRVQLTSTAAGPALALVDAAARATPEIHYPNRASTSASARLATSRGGNKKAAPKPGSKRLLLYGGLAVVIIWLFLPSQAKKKADQLKTEQQIIQADIDAANKLREANEGQILKKMDLTVTTRQAQENFVRGFRDYRKGQFERALMSFQACLALNPEHVLCNRYQRLSQRKFSELVQYEVVLGRKYRDQNQYSACRSAFRNVMVMVKDPNSAIYQEAKANYETCDALVEGRF